MSRLYVVRPVWAAVLLGVLSTGCMTTPKQKVVSGYPLPTAGHTQAASTYVYVVNGLDPVHLAKLPGLVEHLRTSGYPNTRFAELTDVVKIEDDIHQLHESHPRARFALIGYSLGAPVVRNSAVRLLRAGVPIVLVGYIGGDYLSDTTRTQIGGVCRVVNIMGDGHLLTGRNYLFNGTDISGAVNLRLAGTRHFNLPEHPRTLATLVSSLNAATRGF